MTGEAWFLLTWTWLIVGGGAAFARVMFTAEGGEVITPRQARWAVAILVAWPLVGLVAGLYQCVRFAAWLVSDLRPVRVAKAPASPTYRDSARPE